MIFYSIIFGSIFTYVLGGGPQSQQGGNEVDTSWIISITLSNNNPARNQEVFLSIQVKDAQGNPGKNIPLDIILSSSSLPIDIKEIKFLYGSTPETDGNGQYQAIFNAPYFHTHKNGHYAIEASIVKNDGSTISAVQEFIVQEKILDLIGIQIAEPAAPGIWYGVALYDYDRAPITFSILQNGMKRTKIWSEDTWKLSDVMYNDGQGKEENTVTYEIYEAEDEFGSLWRCEGNSNILLEKYGYQTNTTLYHFLISEIYGNNINVSISGYIKGELTNMSFEIPTIPLNRPYVGITDQPGQWSQGAIDTYDGSTIKNVNFYGNGFQNLSTLSLSNDLYGTNQFEFSSDNYLGYYEWKIPENAPPGYYLVTLEGLDSNGTFIRRESSFYITKETIGTQQDEEHHEVLLLLGGISIILLLTVYSVGIYTRIKRRKLLDHITRKRIYEHITSKPGIHFRAILNDLDLKTGTLAHHLNVLEREEYLRSYQDGMYRRFRLFDKKQSSKIVLTNIQGRIVNTIEKNPGVSQTNISKLIGSSRIVVNYHVKILNDVGMIFMEKEGRESHCYCNL
jgi:hypothetical protein